MLAITARVVLGTDRLTTARAIGRIVFFFDEVWEAELTKFSEKKKKKEEYWRD